MRFRHHPIVLSPDQVLHEYWGAKGYFRPTVDILLHAPGSVVSETALLDTGSPYIVFDFEIAEKLGFRGPFRRRAGVRGVGGAGVNLVFPEDGEVQLLLTDYVSEYCVWAPLVGFIEGKRPGGKKTATLGITGFFQYFTVDFPDTNPPSWIDITVKASFPGRKGRGDHRAMFGRCWDENDSSGFLRWAGEDTKKGREYRGRFPATNEQ